MVFFSRFSFFIHHTSLLTNNSSIFPGSRFRRHLSVYFSVHLFLRFALWFFIQIEIRLQSILSLCVSSTLNSQHWHLCCFYIGHITQRLLVQVESLVPVHEFQEIIISIPNENVIACFSNGSGIKRTEDKCGKKKRDREHEDTEKFSVGAFSIANC